MKYISNLLKAGWVPRTLAVILPSSPAAGSLNALPLNALGGGHLNYNTCQSYMNNNNKKGF